MTQENRANIFKLQAEICQTLADPTRLMILHELRDGEKAVGQIVAALGIAQANVSRHLAILRERGIAVTRREGTSIYYRLASPKIAEACDLVREMLESRLASTQTLAKAIGILEMNE